MADYAGAEAAMVDRFKEHWADRTPIALQNGPAITKIDGEGDPAPWVYFEVIGAGSEIIGVGQPGNHQSVQDGHIFIHVFVPVGGGSTEARQLAVAAGEVFRTAEFYRDTPGHCVRTWTPRIDGGGSSADDGLWWRVTTTVPFEYFHRG